MEEKSVEIVIEVKDLNKLKEFFEKYCPQYELFGKTYRSKRDLLKVHSRVSMMNFLYDKERGDGLNQFVDCDDDDDYGALNYSKFYNHSGWKELNKNEANDELMEVAELMWDAFQEELKHKDTNE